MGNLQDVFNLLPNLSTPQTTPSQGGPSKSATENSELAKAMSVKTNDQLMAIYLSSLIRAITAFHDLIENKIQNRQAQEEKDAKKEDGKDDKEGKDGKKVDGTANGEVSKDSKDSTDTKEANGEALSKEKSKGAGKKR